MKKIVIVGLILASFLFASTFSVTAADEERSFTDSPANDVIDTSTEETTDGKPNIDITEVSYVKEIKEVTLTLTVKGDIENRGDINDMESEDYVYYLLTLYTDSHEYYIYYVNRDCQIIIDYEDFGTIDFDYSGSTITFTFDLNSSSETYGGIYVETTDFSSFGEYMDDFIDMPEETLTVKVNAPSTGKVGQSTSFSATVSDGTSPYVYQWNFDDGGTSTEQNPSHTYASAGTYNVTLAVMDSDGKYGLDDAKITISSSATSSGSGTSGSGLLPFIVLVIVIVVAGIAVVVYVMRR